MSSELDSTQPSVCEECGALFKSPVFLLKHKGEKPFQCSACGMRFERKRALNKHLRITLRCKGCCRMYRKPDNLEKHSKICIGRKSNKRTPQEDERDRISNVHRPYECEGCLKSFKHLKCVRVHVKKCSMVNMDATGKGGPSGDPLALSGDENSPITVIDLE